MRTRHAFTLIELMVVVSVILILAALLFPVLAKAKSRTKTTACANNKKQLGLGTAMYTDSYDAFPDGSWGNWVALLADEMSQDYTQSDGTIFVDPANSTHNKSSYPNTLGYPFAGTDYYADLVVNNYVSGGGWGYSGVGIPQVSRPDITPWIMDGTVEQQHPAVAWKDYLEEYTDGSTPRQRLALPHDDKMNLLYVDGHVSLTARGALVLYPDVDFNDPKFESFWDPLRMN